MRRDDDMRRWTWKAGVYLTLMRTSEWRAPPYSPWAEWKRISDFELIGDVSYATYATRS